MKNIYRKQISVKDAAYFVGISEDRLRNLIQKGQIEYAECLQGTGDRHTYIITPSKFFRKYCIGWEDIFEYRQQQQKPKKSNIQRLYRA